MLTRLRDGVRVTLTPEEEAAQIAEWDANKIKHDAEQATQDALDTQIENEKTSLPTWTQVITAIDDAFPDTAQANIVKKIARVAYTYRKNSVN